MGAGSAKAHQSFTVAPATAKPPPVALAGLSAPEEQLEEVSAAALPEAAQDAAGQTTVELPGDSPEEVLTPVPPTAPPGRVTGVPLLVGGADLEDSLATLVAYEGPDGIREVLLATVAPAAEGKLLEALAPAEGQLVAAVVDKQVEERLPLDTEHTLHEQLEAVAKSVNTHLKAKDAIPAHTVAAYDKVVATLAELKSGERTPAEAEMLDAYQAGADALGKRIAEPGATAYDQGGKVPFIAPHLVAQMVSVTEFVPAPPGDAGGHLAPALLRDATRMAPSLDAAGVAHWDGHTRTKVAGKEWSVDLGEGYSAVYRPHEAPAGAAADFSHRGALELVAPPGAGHGPDLVAKLGDLNLVSRPLTKAEGEWAYLQRNVWAQQLERHKGVAASLAEASGLDDAVTEVLVAERQHQALRMGDSQLIRFARGLRLEAEARALPHKVALVREAVAKATGFESGAALAASPGYDPTPRPGGGWLSWDRFDVAAAPGGVDKAFAGKGLVHRVTGKNLGDLLSTGVLASGERRRLMGVAAGKGMSEGADMHSGGARSVFLRVAGAPSSGPALYWADPARLLRRSDWYAYSCDHYGSLNPGSGHSTAGQTRSPVAVAGFPATSSNEVMFRHGIDLLGSEAPTTIRCGSAGQRSSILAMLKARGIHQLGGRSVEEVVQ